MSANLQRTFEFLGGDLVYLVLLNQCFLGGGGGGETLFTWCFSTSARTMNDFVSFTNGSQQHLKQDIDFIFIKNLSHLEVKGARQYKPVAWSVSSYADTRLNLYIHHKDDS